MLNNDNCKFDIHLVNDEEKTMMDIKAKDKSSVLTALSIFVKLLKEQGKIDETKIRYAFDLGLGKDIDKPKIHVKEIHISKENEKDFEELLKKLAKEEN